jgi:hypothetical protein
MAYVSGRLISDHLVDDHAIIARHRQRKHHRTAQPTAGVRLRRATGCRTPPHPWFADPGRCAQAGFDPDHTFRTKPEIALEQAERVLAAGVAVRWATADEVYGRNGKFRRFFETRDIALPDDCPLATVVGRCRESTAAVPGKGLRMPLVFVHGIGNRPDSRCQSAATARDELFKRFMFPVINAWPDTDVVRNPLWGPSAGMLRWGGVSLRIDDVEALGGAGDDGLRDEVAATEDIAVPDRIVCGVARRDLGDAIDLVFGLLSADDWDPSVADSAARAVAFCHHHRLLRPGLDEVERHPWIAEVENDSELVAELLERSAQWHLAGDLRPAHAGAGDRIESMGGAGAVRKALTKGVRRLGQHVMGIPVRRVASGVRRATSRTVTELAGDVLAYLAQRGDRDRPGPIVRAVLDDLDQATRERKPDQPLVVVAHSMGGNILYDIVTHFRTDLEVDVLVTVGSQVGLFAELGLFRASGPVLSSHSETPPPCLARPENVAQWINVVDRADVLSYGVSRIVSGTTDYCYPTDAIWAHSAYFRQPNFHLRLAERVKGALA